MAVRVDFAIDDNNELLFSNGDLALQESDQQHIIDTINANVGWWKEYPTDGVGIINYQNESGSIQKLSRKIKIELEKDGYKIDNPIIEFDNAGKLTIYPNATII